MGNNWYFFKCTAHASAEIATNLATLSDEKLKEAVQANKYEKSTICKNEVEMHLGYSKSYGESSKNYSKSDGESSKNGIPYYLDLNQALNVIQPLKNNEQETGFYECMRKFFDLTQQDVQNALNKKNDNQIVEKPRKKSPEEFLASTQKLRTNLNTDTTNALNTYGGKPSGINVNELKDGNNINETGGVPSKNAQGGDGKQQKQTANSKINILV